jgi:hypothetical protein
MLVVLIGFFATRAIVRSMWNDQPQPPDNGDASAPAVIPPSAPGLSGFQQLRLFALRQALDASHLGTVRFRIDQGTLILSGTIPSEDDRDTVYRMCAGIAGVASLRDNLRVADPSSGG